MERKRILCITEDGTTGEEENSRYNRREQQERERNLGITGGNTRRAREL